MRTAILAVALLALACGNKKEAAPAAGSAGSATGSGASSADAGAGSDAACDEQEIRRRIDTGLSQSAAYVGALEQRTARWKKDCEAAARDLLALEPDAQRFMDGMHDFTSWAQTLSVDCRKRVTELGEEHPLTAELDKRTPAIEERVRPMLERCKDHPGFKDAAAKGLRLARTKKN